MAKRRKPQPQGRPGGKNMTPEEEIAALHRAMSWLIFPLNGETDASERIALTETIDALRAMRAQIVLEFGLSPAH